MLTRQSCQHSETRKGTQMVEALLVVMLLGGSQLLKMRSNSPRNVNGSTSRRLFGMSPLQNS
ncbi:hypothetical protein ID866_7045 [Astraeus odoratus]|nr:hypothetical protein ID866_7045 [Astraeus odoratus]